MKYMGNKGKMLPVLGDILSFHSRDAGCIADPFCGSAAVSWFLAETTNKEIISSQNAHKTPIEIPLNGNWQVDFIKGEPALPKGFSTGKLESWTKFPL